MLVWSLKHTKAATFESQCLLQFFFFFLWQLNDFFECARTCSFSVVLSYTRENRGWKTSCVTFEIVTLKKGDPVWDHSQSAVPRLTLVHQDGNNNNNKMETVCCQSAIKCQLAGKIYIWSRHSESSQNFESRNSEIPPQVVTLLLQSGNLIVKSQRNSAALCLFKKRIRVQTASNQRVESSIAKRSIRDESYHWHRLTQIGCMSNYLQTFTSLIVITVWVRLRLSGGRLPPTGRHVQLSVLRIQHQDDCWLVQLQTFFWLPGVCCNIFGKWQS